MSNNNLESVYNVKDKKQRFNPIFDFPIVNSPQIGVSIVTIGIPIFVTGQYY